MKDISSDLVLDTLLKIIRDYKKDQNITKDDHITQLLSSLQVRQVEEALERKLDTGEIKTNDNFWYDTDDWLPEGVTKYNPTIEKFAQDLHYVIKNPAW